jgi:hypothetical protein
LTPRLHRLLAPVFSTIAHGNIAVSENTVETVSATNANTTNAQTGVGSRLDESDFQPMAHVNVESNSTTLGQFGHAEQAHQLDRPVRRL